MLGISRLQAHVQAWLARTDPARREITVASFFLLLLLVVGSAGYALIEGWSFMDGLYMTFITLTTIGFTEVHTLHTGGRIFTIGIGIVGIGTVTFIATRTAQLLIASRRIRERHMRRMIEQIQDHYLLCGYGRIGTRIADDLARAGTPFVVIDRDEHLSDSLADAHYLHVLGDAEEETTLRQAGIERARGLILTLPEDSANVFVTLVARELNEELFILARANALKNQPKLMHAGADKVLSPDEIGADRMAQVILRPNVDRFMEQVLRTGALGLQMEEVEVFEDAPLAGKSLAQSNFRQQFDAIVVAVIENETGEMRFNPSAHHQIEAGDVLIVLGSQEMIQRLRRAGCRA